MKRRIRGGEVFPYKGGRKRPPEKPGPHDELIKRIQFQELVQYLKEHNRLHMLPKHIRDKL